MTARMTRRELVQRGAAGVAFLSLPGLLAACGGGGRRQRLDRGQRRSQLLELAALHRLRREDEEAPDARPVHREDRDQGQLLRGHQLQLRVLREDPGPALAGPRDRPRHHRLHRQLALPAAHDRQGLGRGPRQGQDPEHRQPDRRAGARRRSIPTAQVSLPWQSGMTGIAWNEKVSGPVTSVTSCSRTRS